MFLRRWINSHSAFVITIALLVTVTAVCWRVNRDWLGPVRWGTVPRAWFYDLNTGKLFVARSDAVPPIDAPSGPLPSGDPAGVRAKVFAIGDCADSAHRFIGWLETHTPEARAAVSDRRGLEMDAEGVPVNYLDGLMVRAVDAKTWVSANSEQGKAIFQSIKNKCPPGSVLRACLP